MRFEVLTTVTEDYCVLGCDAIYSGKSVQMLQRNLLPYLWSRWLHSDNGASRFLWNIGALIPDYVVSHTRRLYLFIMYKYLCISYWINCFCCVYQSPYAVNFRLLFTFFVKVHFTSVCYFVLYFNMSELCVCHLSKVLYRHLQSGVMSWYSVNIWANSWCSILSIDDAILVTVRCDYDSFTNGRCFCRNVFWWLLCSQLYMCLWLLFCI